jgi:dUTP pyrophosphatase
MNKRGGGARMKVEVYRLVDNAKLPVKSTEGSVGYDVFSVEDVEIKPGEFRLIRTGLVVKSEYPFALFLFPRSSLFKAKGLIMANSVGVVDFDYCGEGDEVKVPVVNISNDVAYIKAGEKVAQMVFLCVGSPEIVEVNELSQRGSRGGFGSTGGYHV